DARGARRDGGRRGHGHRQHLRQVRLDEPGRAAPDERVRAHARRALRAGRPAVAARRRLRRGGAHAHVGPAPRRAPRRRDRPRRRAAARAVAEAPGAEPHLQGHEGREPALRRRRVRRRDGDRGARARARPRAHGRRDGARRERPPARLRAARADVARAEHGPRRLPQGARQHAGAPQPLVQAQLRRAAVAPRRRHPGALAVSVDHAACPPL
ncbi:MAG: hypothetical protein AVDCRST_MAG67-4372, partial [uncultured Solirubrobacteraceae bacterium]